MTPQRRILYLSFFGILLMLLPLRGVAQYYQFSQFYSSPILLGPSFSGLLNKGTNSRLVMNYRDQWPQLRGTFVTYAVAYDQYLPKVKSGFSVYMLSDVAGRGSLGVTQVALGYSYNIKLNPKTFVRPGVSFSYSQRTLNIHNLLFGDQLYIDNSSNPTGGPQTTDESIDTDRKGYFDASASTIIFTKEFWGGVTFDHLFTPNQAFNTSSNSDLPVQINMYGGARIYIEKGTARKRNDQSITPCILYKYRGSFDQMDIGCYYHKTPIVFGAWFRGLPAFKGRDNALENVDALALLLGWKVKTFSMGYSFDITISDLSVQRTGGSHEISIIWEFNRAKLGSYKERRAQVPCPMF